MFSSLHSLTVRSASALQISNLEQLLRMIGFDVSKLLSLSSSSFRPSSPISMISSCSELSLEVWDDQVFQGIQFPCLLKLKLSGPQVYISEMSIETMLLKFPKLRDLRIFATTDVSSFVSPTLGTVSSSVSSQRSVFGTSLRPVKLCHCLIALAESKRICCDLQHLSFVQEIVLAGDDDSDESADEKLLQRLILLFPRLKYLGLSFVSKETARGVTRWLQRDNIAKMTKLRKVNN